MPPMRLWEPTASRNVGERERETGRKIEGERGGGEKGDIERERETKPDVLALQCEPDLPARPCLSFKVNLVNHHHISRGQYTCLYGHEGRPCHSCTGICYSRRSAVARGQKLNHLIWLLLSGDTAL